MNAKDQQATNSLSHLLGDYNSDTDNEDTVKSNPEMIAKVDEFCNELTIDLPASGTHWTECIDKATGHPYYWNIATKEVTWELPAEYANFLERRVGGTGDVQNQWHMYYTDDNVPYYVNEHTRKVSWEKPTGYAEPFQPKMMKQNVEDKNVNNNKKRQLDCVDRSEVKLKKKYPFAEDETETEKIELITSFEDKSDSTSGEEDNRKTEKCYKKLNLVAAYNSDNEQVDEDPDLVTKPLFAGTATTAVVVGPALQLNVEQNKNDKQNESILLSLSSSAIGPSVQEKPVKQSFASIITGGRSPDNKIECNVIPLNECDEEKPVKVSEPELDGKAFQRRRRIEFITKTKPAPSMVNYPQPLEETVESEQVNDGNDSIQNNKSNGNGDTVSVQNLYTNFKRSHVEFATGNSDNSNENIIVNNEINVKQSENIARLRSVIEAKLKFLCDGRPEVSAVQAIMIQLDTLVEAYEDQALQPAYIHKWLENISSDLTTLERDAAPAGWKCLWNRKKSRYYYKNLATGDIQWDYPESDVPNRDEEAMDICTTPPPDSDEQSLIEDKKSKKVTDQNDSNRNDLPSWIPPPPVISSTEPLPPGIDATEYDTTANTAAVTKTDISLELESFYSDLATIESTSTTETVTKPEDQNPPTSDQPTVPPTATGTTESNRNNKIADQSQSIKKKKKKVKKREPWRSGNLETWINQWQKAQREL